MYLSRFVPLLLGRSASTKPLRLHQQPAVQETMRVPFRKIICLLAQLLARRPGEAQAAQRVRMILGKRSVRSSKLHVLSCSVARVRYKSSMYESG